MYYVIPKVKCLLYVIMFAECVISNQHAGDGGGCITYDVNKNKDQLTTYCTCMFVRVLDT